MAINKAGTTEPAKIREAILGRQEISRRRRRIQFRSEWRRLHGYNVVRNEKGTIVYDKHIDFND